MSKKPTTSTNKLPDKPKSSSNTPSKPKPIVPEEKKIENPPETAARVSSARAASARIASAKKSKENIENLDQKSIPTDSKEIEPVIDEKDLNNAVNTILETDSTFVVLDESARVAAFLRHRDVNYLNCLEKNDMESEKFRLALIGSLRFGKPLVFDLMESENLLENIENIFAELDAKLFEHICDRSILKEEAFMKYVKESDGETYKSFNFVDNITNNHKLVILLAKSTASNKLLTLGKCIRVV